MIVYWAFVAIPAVLSLGEKMLARQGSYRMLSRLLLVALFFFMAFRETGGDFSTYLRLSRILGSVGLTTAISITEPIYGFLNWTSALFGFGIYGVNTVCALIFLYALNQLAKQERLGFFLLTLAIPYFVIVVGMGYSRQGVAVALVLLALLQLRKGRTTAFFGYIALAAGFHFSALLWVILPLFTGLQYRSKLVDFAAKAALVTLALIAVPGLFQDRIAVYSLHYIESDRYESGGAVLRALVHGAAAMFFFMFARQWREQYDDYKIWRPFALIALLNIPLAFVASTPVDRIGLYLFPFQILTFARLPTFQTSQNGVLQAKLAILTAFILYFFVWLHLGAYSASLWVPYRWYFW